MRGLLLALLLFAAGYAPAAHITDRVVIGLYDKPDLSGEPRRLLGSGTPIEVLARRGSRVRVRLGDGTTGWIEARYVSEETPAAMQLLEARAEIRRLRQRLARQTPQVGVAATDAPLPSAAGVRVGIELAEARARIAELERQLAELPTLREAAAERDELAARLRQVRELLGTDDVAQEAGKIGVAPPYPGRFWGMAGLLLLAGFLAGAALSRWRQRQREAGR